MPAPRVRVLVIGLHYNPESTGNAPYTTSLAEGLYAAGHSVSVITGYPHYPEWQLHEGYRGWSARESINAVSVRRLRHYIASPPTTLNRMHMELSFGTRVLFSRWGDPDVVVLVTPALFSSALALMRVKLGFKKPRSVLWVQDIYSRGLAETGNGESSAKLSSTLMARFEALVFRSSDKVVAIHDRFKKYLVEGLGVDAGRIRVIRNWTHLEPAESKDRAEMRASLGWEAKDIIALHSGNMGKKQGLDNVIEAARIAQQQGSKVRFILMGDGNQRSRLQHLARGVPNCQFLSALPAVEFQAALAAADVLLVNELPGVRDMSVPSKLTSYFSSGVPVIAATDEESVTAEEIASSGGGIRVDADSPYDLLEAIESLHAQKALAASLGVNGLRFRHETLSKDAALAQYDDVISILASPRAL